MLLHAVLVSHTKKVVIFGTGIYQKSKQVIVNFNQIIERITLSLLQQQIDTNQYSIEAEDD